MKVPVLDLALWVEETKLSSPGLDIQSMHNNCKERENCLPLVENNIGDKSSHAAGLEGALESVTRMV